MRAMLATRLTAGASGVPPLEGVDETSARTLRHDNRSTKVSAPDRVSRLEHDTRASDPPNQLLLSLVGTNLHRAITMSARPRIEPSRKR